MSALRCWPGALARLVDSPGFSADVNRDRIVQVVERGSPHDDDFFFGAPTWHCEATEPLPTVILYTSLPGNPLVCCVVPDECLEPISQRPAEQAIDRQEPVEA